MSQMAPDALVKLLAELGLALPAEVESMSGRVRRLARALPDFEQVWVDALAQSRLLTYYQAAEINAGRGRGLGLGPLVLCEPLEDLGYARSFRARLREGGRSLRACLLPAEPSDAEAWNARLAELMRKQVRANHRALVPVEQFGAAAGRFWISCRHIDAQPVAAWLLHRGRMPPPAVHELARQMCDALAVLHEAGIAHGDLSPRQVLVDARGQLVLPMPGLRPIVRPSEGFATAGLAPETYDYLAPERIALGTPSDLASDLYACGALWWHLLAGRPPVPGASGLTKMRSALTTRLPALAPIAPDAAGALVRAVEQCMARDPGQRPGTYAAVAELLGPTSVKHRRTLASCALFPGRGRVMRQPGALRARRLARRAAMAAAMASLLIAIASWPYWGNRLLGTLKPTAARKPSAWIADDRNASHTLPGQKEQPQSAEGSRIAVRQPARAFVSPATYAEPASPTGASDVLELDRSVRWNELRLRNGITVRARRGRVRVDAGETAAALVAEDVTFENIDFSGGEANSPIGSILSCRVARVRFINCSWQAAGPSDKIAIDWHPPADPTTASSAAELTCDDCMWANVAAGISLAPRPALAIGINNSLHLGYGPLVKLTAAPGADDQVVVSASHLTLRDCRGLLECPGPQSDALGTITVRAESCALAPKQGHGLITFTGDQDPAPLLALLRWLGQGSVVTQQAPLVVWRRDDGREQSAAEDSVQVAGLVRSGLEFAGPRHRDAASSRVLRWQVPLQSADPPGILEARLPAAEPQ